MRYKPHDYQKYAIHFIKEHPIAAVLLDMGMGKKLHYTDGHYGSDVWQLRGI